MLFKNSQVWNSEILKSFKMIETQGRPGLYGTRGKVGQSSFGMFHLLKKSVICTIHVKGQKNTFTKNVEHNYALCLRYDQKNEITGHSTNSRFSYQSFDILSIKFLENQCNESKACSFQFVFLSLFILFHSMKMLQNRT